MFKVKREGTKSLCDTCRHSKIWHDIYGRTNANCCYIREHPILVPVADCSGYDDKRQPSKYEMEEHAWLLITEARHGEAVGFVSPEQRKKEKKDIDQY